MPSKRFYKTKSHHGAMLRDFFEAQKRKGIRWTSLKDLKDWAADVEEMSYTTLYELLKDLSWYVVKEKNPDGLQGVFYGLSPKWRNQFMEDNRVLHERVSEIHELPDPEKKEQLKSLIGLTMIRFKEFVPFIVDHAVKNEESIEDLQEWLTGCFQWVLLPYLFETIRACWREKELFQAYM